MKYKEAMEKLVEEQIEGAQGLKLLKPLFTPEREPHISRVTPRDIWFTSCEFTEVLEILHGLEYTLNTYALSSLDTLAIYYTLTKYKVDFNFIVPYTKELLDKISGGKCHVIEERTLASTRKVITCDL